jgi:hypothetical protein
VVAAMFGLGIWSFNNMRESRPPRMVYHQAGRVHTESVSQ